MSLRAVQLVRGEVLVRFGYRTMGHAVVAGYEASHRLALEWQTRPHSINFSLRTGLSGVMIEGRPRQGASLLMYVEPGVSSWAGPLVASPTIPSSDPAFHISIPFEGGQILGLPPRVLMRGWLEVPLQAKVAAGFANWAKEAVFGWQERERPLQDEVYWWLQRALEPAVDGETEFVTPSHYTWIVHAVNNLLENDAPRSWLVTDLAGALHVSVRTVQRAFRSIYGIGVTQYLRNRRLERARDQLRAGGGTVHRVAHENGFNHVPRFSQQYRKLFGFNPSETLQRV